MKKQLSTMKNKKNVILNSIQDLWMKISHIRHIRQILISPPSVILSEVEGSRFLHFGRNDKSNRHLFESEGPQSRGPGGRRPIGSLWDSIAALQNDKRAGSRMTSRRQPSLTRRQRWFFILTTLIPLITLISLMHYYLPMGNPAKPL